MPLPILGALEEKIQKALAEALLSAIKNRRIEISVSISIDPEEPALHLPPSPASE